MPLPTALGKVVGKPWTAWVSLAGASSPSDPTSTHSRRLNRSEMAIFGSCPAAERLTLIPCTYCGDKFKYQALSEHVRVRHGGAKKPVVKLISPDKKKSPLKKGKHGRFVKDKEKPILIKEEPIDDDDKSQDWANKSAEIEENHRNEREIPVSSVVPQFMLKSSSESVKESPKTKGVKVKKSKPPDLPVIVDVPDAKSPSQKRDAALELSPGKDKFKAEVSSKKAKIEQQDEGKTDVVEPPTLTQEVKTPEVKKKKNQKSNARGGRVYDPDIHCGVISKESARPCTRSLICKLHSITLRKAVKGRSKSFDVLVSALQREKELERSKSLDVEVKISSEPEEVKSKPEPKVQSDVKLSLPVSIKNPNLWSQLQARKPLVEPAKPVAPNAALLKKANKTLIYRVLKDDRRENIKHINVLPRNVNANGVRKNRDLPFEGFLLPGYRRTNGLLTTALTTPKMFFKDGRKPRMNVARDQTLKTPPRNNYLLYLNNSIRNNLPDVHRDDAKCFDLLKLPERNVIASMPGIAAQVNPLKSPGCRDSNVVTKPLNLFGPVNGTTVLPVGLTPPSKEPHVDLGSAGLLCEDVVRLDSPRTHFFTPSGPLSLSVDRSCKNRLYLPNSSLSASPAGIVYLQRTIKTVY